MPKATSQPGLVLGARDSQWAVENNRPTNQTRVRPLPANRVQACSGAYELAANAGPQLVLAFGGSGSAAPAGGDALTVGEGAVFFVPAGVTVSLTADAGDAPLVLGATMIGAMMTTGMN